MTGTPNNNDKLKETAADTAAAVLGPISGLLLECGLGVPELYQVIKWCFVHEAADRLRRQKRRANVSRIAAQTGLTRQEVARLLRADSKPATQYEWHKQRSNRVLLGWFSDAEFLKPDGTPRALTYEGPDSFATLAKKYSGDIPPRAMLDELVSKKAVAAQKDGTYVPKSRSVSDARLGAKRVAEIGKKLSLVASALTDNISDSSTFAVYEELALTTDISSSSARSAGAALNRRSQNFIEVAQRLLSDVESTGRSQPGEESVTLGVYVTVIHRKQHDGK